jgi:peptidylprolyl isomerase
MSSLSRHGILVALSAVAFAGTLSACGSSGPTAGTLPTVTGAFGVAPKISFPSSAPPKTLRVKVLKEGTGPVAQLGQLLVGNYYGQIWGGKVFGSSFTQHELAGFQLSQGQVIKAWYEGIVGARAGTRLLLVVPPSYGYGAQGNSQAGITGTDTLAFVVDVVASYSRSVTGPGDAIPMQATHLGVTVSWPGGAAPSVKISSGAPRPTTATFTLLARGTGPKITTGVVVIQYVVASYATGKAVESTWQAGEAPQAEPVGGADSSPLLNHLLGLPLGSRFLLRVPKSSSDGSSPSGPYAFAVEVVAEPSITTPGASISR